MHKCLINFYPRNYLEVQLVVVFVQPPYSLFLRKPLHNISESRYNFRHLHRSLHRCQMPFLLLLLLGILLNEPQALVELAVLPYSFFHRKLLHNISESRYNYYHLHRCFHRCQMPFLLLLLMGILLDDLQI